MCGIFSLLNYSNTNKNQRLSQQTIEEEFKKGSERGPEHSGLELNELSNTVIGFHRLAINGLNDASNQPIKIGEYTLICNGEIFS